MSSSIEAIHYDGNECEVCPISGERRSEEMLNYFTHLLGLILSIIGGSILFFSALERDTWHFVASIIYITTLIALYAASTFYHRCQTPQRKKLLQIVDHAAIYFFIAGSYTPFTLGPLRDANGWQLFLLVWTIAILGMTYKFFAIGRHKFLSLFSYLMMGWLVAFYLPNAMDLISSNALFWLILGGVSYTAGTLFYMWKNLPYSHGIWHLFVLCGSFCHYLAIYDLFTTIAIEPIAKN